MNGNKKKFCLIDDDEISIFVTKKLITNADLAESEEVISFGTGMAALNYLREHIVNGNVLELPDLIFLDINLKDMTGWEFLDYFREMNIESDKIPPIVMLSSSLFPRDRQRAAKYEEVAEFVVKPLNKERLLEIKSLYVNDGNK